MYYTSKNKQRTLEDREGKTHHSNCHYSGICSLLPPFQDSSRKGFSIFFTKHEACLGDLDPGCARGQCSHCTFRVQGGERGGNQNEYLFLSISSLSQSCSEETSKGLFPKALATEMIGDGHSAYPARPGRHRLTLLPPGCCSPK